MVNRKSSHHLTAVDFHRFLEIEKTATHLEIAEALGLSIREVDVLKKKVIRLDNTSMIH